MSMFPSLSRSSRGRRRWDSQESLVNLASAHLRQAIKQLQPSVAAAAAAAAASG